MIVLLILVVNLVLLVFGRIRISIKFLPTYFAVEVAMLLLAKLAIDTADKFLQGDEGEDIVGHTLRKLSPGYVILENIVISKYGNIDFVVVGPRGVAIVEVKSHKSIFTYHDRNIFRNGKQMGFIRQIESQVNELSRLLHGKIKYYSGVNAFLVFSSKFARIKFGMKPLPGTNIVAVKSEWINNAILSPKGTDLNSQQITQIVDLLRVYQKD